MCTCASGNNCGGLTCGEGAAGLNGLNAFTLTTGTFLQPAFGDPAITINVSALGQYTGTWAGVGQWIFIEGAGLFQVVTSSATVITAIVPSSVIQAYNYSIASNGSTIAIGSKVSPAGVVGATGATGASGSNGTSVLAYELNSPTQNSTSYTSLAGTHVIPANTWEELGDTVRIKAFFHGEPGGTSTNKYNYNFKITIGSVDVSIIFFGIELTEILQSSNIQDAFGNYLNGIKLELDLVAYSLSPFSVVAIPKGEGIGYAIGSSTYTEDDIFTFYIPNGTPLIVDYQTYQVNAAANNITTGIDPTIANNLTVSGKMTQVGTGGGVTPEYACPLLLVERLKKEP